MSTRCPACPISGRRWKTFYHQKINLGLDLKGGIHLTLGVDVAKAVSNSLALAGQDIRRLAKDEKIVVLHPAWWAMTNWNLPCPV